MKTLLIVDDDAAYRRAMTRMLRDEGFDYIREADDGVQGLAMARAETPSIIITDGEMRRMHGPELIEELRKDSTLANVPVIMASGASHMKDAAILLGVPFFTKAGDSPRDLVALVRKALGAV